MGAHPVVAAAQGQHGHIDFAGVCVGGEDAVNHLVDGAVAASRHKVPYAVVAQLSGGFDAFAGVVRDVQLVPDAVPG